MACGTIRYGDDLEGTFVDLKLSYTGTETEYIRHYRDSHPAFPHQSTADQFFDETQFEVDRALGSHVAGGVTDRLREALNGPA